MRQIVLDTETTGLSPEAGDRIIEIGCVELINRKLTGNNFHFYLNPDRAIHEDAMKVHGISNEFLNDKPRFENIVDEFLTYVGGAQIIIHNAPFDVGFLNAELRLLEKKPFKDYVLGVLDTLAMAKELYPGKRNSLDALCERLGVSNTARTLHGGLLDAELLADVYVNLTRGQNALLIDAEPNSEIHQTSLSIDYSKFVLPVIQPNVEELLAHEEVLSQIDKTSEGKTLWRSIN